MSDLHTRFHETWLGMVQPIEGLVVSLPVLVDSQCMERRGPQVQEKFRELCPLHDAELGLELRDELSPRSKAGGRNTGGRKKRETLKQQRRDGKRRYRDLPAFLEGVLEWTPDLYDTGDALPEDLSRYISEGHQWLRPTLALRKLAGATSQAPKDGVPDIETPESEAGRAYEALVWELPTGMPFDTPETETGEWRYPPAAKFDRLLRACRVPIGLLCNGDSVRLVYAPHGEATGAITFGIGDMGEVAGRPILDAFVMLLSAQRFFNAQKGDDTLPALLRLSRERQANVTNTLAGQVFDALDILLRGFESAAQRDRHSDLRHLLELSLGHDPDTRLSEDDHIYGGLLTVLLRLVFLLYAEDRELLPTNNPHYIKGISLTQLFEDLRRDHGTFPDTMNRRYGAWPRVLSLFRTIHDGVEHGEFHIPRRRGELFDPGRFPFLESWQMPDSAVAKLPTDMAQVGVPTIDDETVYFVLERLLLLDGQRLSYKVLDVEQIGSVYEALMGYGVLSLTSPAVCCRHKSLQSGSRGGVWIEAGAVAAQKPGNRSKFLLTEYDVVKAHATKIAKDLKAAENEAEILAALDKIAIKKVERRGLGQLALQPGEERRRTSSHYTPRSLSQPIVRRTLEPLLAAMSSKGEPSSQQLLSLKICDPAMGSGAFLVETCRFLGDHVVAAWEREGQTDKIASAKEDVVNHARRLVAQKCLYGVDKNPFAVHLAKLSLWLVTLAKEEPFTFVDHCLRHGDSLVGLSFAQIKAFHWKPEGQMDLIEKALADCIEESLSLRQQILDMAGETGPGVTREKEQLLWDANDAQERARIIGDLVVGAFFAHGKDKDRKAERIRRLDLVSTWLADGGGVPEEIAEMSVAIRRQLPVFHWWLEFPEVFHGERADPLEAGEVNHAALMDAFLGNPPFMHGLQVARSFGTSYTDWITRTLEGTDGRADLCSHFFVACSRYLGAHGTMGLIGTKTIAQGDTRSSGLENLLARGFKIYDATTRMSWPGNAAVIVSVVHLAIGSPHELVSKAVFDGKAVACVNSRLRPKPERPAPSTLTTNQEMAFQGWHIYGGGFVVSPDERDSLVKSNPATEKILFPYLGGQEVNSDPRQEHSRYVINYGMRTLSEAEGWPEALRIVRERVKPYRDGLKDTALSRNLQKNWWRFYSQREELQALLKGQERCLVVSRVTKHLMFSFQPVTRIFSEALYVFPHSSPAIFAVLQSRIHVVWAWLLSSTMKNDLRYAATDCLATFPIGSMLELTKEEHLVGVGDELLDARAAVMVLKEQGLTETYNQLKDPECRDSQIEGLRVLHEELDRAVLAYLGWNDIEVPRYEIPTVEADRMRQVGDFSEVELELGRAYEDEIIDRLFALNATRAAQERALGLTGKKGKAAKKPRKKTTKKPSAQLTLGES